MNRNGHSPRIIQPNQLAVQFQHIPMANATAVGFAVPTDGALNLIVAGGMPTVVQLAGTILAGCDSVVNMSDPDRTDAKRAVSNAMDLAEMVIGEYGRRVNAASQVAQEQAQAKPENGSPIITPES